MDSEVLSRLVHFVVESHSGGVKFTELISDLIGIIHADTEIDNSEVTGDFPVEVERIIQDSDELKVLKYTFRTLEREKMFVYTP